NSLFGVLGSPASRLFSPAVANAITTAGQHVIRLAAAAVAERGHCVIYGDTDSLFVDAGEPDTARAAARAEELRDGIGRDVAAALTRDFGCTSHLELEFEKVYARFFMPEIRGGAMGSKKRYAGLVVGPAGETLEIVGLEAVRRDWSEVARRFQRELLDLVFHDRPVAEFIRAFVAELRAGRFDTELAYRKAIRKPLAEYTKTTPPHVKAARKRPSGRLQAGICPDVENGGGRLQGRGREIEPVDAGDLEAVPDDRRPRPAHRLRRRDVLVGAPLEARVEVGVEAVEVGDRF